MGIEIDQPGKQKELGDLLGVSVTTIGQYEQRGIWERNDTLRVQLHKYISYLRERAAGRAAAGGLDLATERAALAAIQKEKVELEVQKMRGDLVDASVIRREIFTLARHVRNSFQSLPNRVALQVAAEGDHRVVYELLEGEVDQVLLELVNQLEKTNFNQIQQENRE